MTDRQPRAESLRPPRDPAAWSDALDRLDGSGTYWLATVRPDGRPHLVPVPAVWVGGTVHFCAGPGTGKVRNLTHSPDCAISVGGDGLDLVVEGQAVQVTDEPALRAVAEAYASTSRHAVSSYPLASEARASRSTGWPVIPAMRSKSLSRWSTARPAISAVAATRRSGIAGARCSLRSASRVCTSTARSSIAGVRYSTGSDARGGWLWAARRSLPDRAEKPTSNRVTVVMRTSPRSIRVAHSSASTLTASRTSADLSINQLVNPMPGA